MRIDAVLRDLCGLLFKKVKGRMTETWWHENQT